MPNQPKPAKAITRHAEARVLGAMADTRIVALDGKAVFAATPPKPGNLRGCSDGCGTLGFTSARLWHAVVGFYPRSQST